MALWVGKRYNGNLEFSTIGENWNAVIGFPYSSSFIGRVSVACPLRKYIKVTTLKEGECARVLDGVLPIKIRKEEKK